MKVHYSRAMITLALTVSVGGCELFEPPMAKAPKQATAAAGTAKPEAPAQGQPQVWKKQSLAGVNFEAPFDVVSSPEG